MKSKDVVPVNPSEDGHMAYVCKRKRVAALPYGIYILNML